MARETQSPSLDSLCWKAGPWQVEPRGLLACGNPRAAGPQVPSAEKLAKLQTSASEGREAGKCFVERLSSRSDACRVITKSEVEELLELTGAGEEVWESIQADAQIQVRRHRDRSLFGGCVFVKLSAHIPDAQAAHVAHCFLNFADRAGWDKQMDGFNVLHNVAGNDLLYSVIHASPLADRDFLVFQMLFRHEHGRGLMFYSRSADDDLCPPTRNIRARQYVSATEIMQNPGGGVTFTTTTAVDPQIPFLPKWIMNLLVPSEFRRWANAVEHRCKELRGTDVPCSMLFATVDECVATDAVDADDISTAEGSVVTSAEPELYSKPEAVEYQRPSLKVAMSSTAADEKDCVVSSNSPGSTRLDSESLWSPATDASPDIPLLEDDVVVSLSPSSHEPWSWCTPCKISNR
eukprot:gb/GFBE01009668.1/.p1 GENE.gb/GFBE01009668.1/~~gb/GFBE01009668.1/.p1  ORF type:complete len:406 (+),score=81.46 gb/GFBE01009668.1/:1-1218(+)